MITKTNRLIHLVGNCKIFFSYKENYYVKNMPGNSCVFMLKARTRVDFSMRNYVFLC